MSELLRLIKVLLPSLQSQQQLDKAYLAEAVDIDDLERRMREIDDRGSNSIHGVHAGLGLQ
jgi:hypothetical protein